VVLEAAAAFLAVRPRSVAETRGRLLRLGYPPALLDRVIGRLLEIGFLDDVAFARWWVESRDRARPRGVLALRRELVRKGVPRDALDHVLAEREAGSGGRADPSPDDGRSADRDAARRLLAKRAASLHRELDPRRRRQKAYALLARHGFTPDVCGEASLAVLVTGEPGEEDPAPV
jgi:regulatory protein